MTFNHIIMGRYTSIYAKKHKRTRDNDMEKDRISQLPDEVLVSILSFLTMKEAARTSILTRRWRGVWTYIPCLNFDASETLHSLWVQQEGLNLCKERCKYIKWVNNVLDAYDHQGCCFIDEFRVRFDLDAEYASDIARWFNFSVEKKVKRLVMDFRGLFGSFQQNVCAIPLLSSRVLHTAEFPDCSSLRILHLKYLNISGVVIEHLISTCPYLEQLNIQGSVSLTDLNVVGQSLRLKCLKLKLCSHLKSVYLSAPSLVSFHFQHYDFKMIEITFANVPNLVEVFFGGTCSLRKLHPVLDYLSQLETLTLSVDPPKKTIGVIEFPVLAHLKNLRLKVTAADDVSLLGFTLLMKAAPSLCRLVLDLRWWSSNCSFARRRMTSAGCPQQCLKVVEIVGFVGENNDMEFATYLIEHAPMLEKVILEPPPKHKSIKWHSSAWMYTAILVGSRKGAMLLDSKFSLGDKLVLRNF